MKNIHTVLPNGNTDVYGIIGNPIEHSLSPEIHSTAFQILNVNAIYVPFLVKKIDFEHTINALKTLNIRGINITIPYKELILPYLDELSNISRFVSSVNTIYRIKEKWIGTTTDGAGYLEGLMELGFTPYEKKVQIIGSGGTGKIIAYSLAQQKNSIRIFNRTETKVDKLISTLKEHFPQGDIEKGIWEEKFDLLVNTTSVGMDGEKKPVSDEVIEQSTVVSDVIYSPRLTPLLKKAQEMKKITQNGLPMLLHQGALSFKLWTNKEFPLQKN